MNGMQQIDGTAAATAAKCLCQTCQTRDWNAFEMAAPLIDPSFSTVSDNNPSLVVPSGAGLERGEREAIAVGSIETISIILHLACL